ncbi:MAG: hypothetical protein JO301_04665 [Chitinophagaceae bacterium]|nr:hypothetical protein [Chitinophagaceae bacterium]
MRLIFTLFSVLLLVGSAGAQKITGIWRGYFTSSSLAARDMPDERYKYEVQIQQLSNNSIKGVTYSYKSTVFYGKAELSGILTLPAKSLIIRETKLVDLRIKDRSEPCLMTCYLDYARIGKLEVLEGTFISVDVTGKRDCGSGKIYLERVASSDFKTEEFLVKKKPENPRPTPNISLPPAGSSDKGRDNMAVKPIPGRPGTKSPAPLVKTNPQTTPPAVKKSTPASTNTPKTNTATAKVNPKKEDPRVQAPKPEEKKTEQPVVPNKEEPTVSQQRPEQVKKVPLPKVLVERENNLVKVINTSEADLVISLYDNGTIDNDTISVYHNNELVISNKKLTYSPLSVKIHCTRSDPRHEFIMVAENLGDIPPNTAVMVITSPSDSRLRYEVTLASTESKNAKVIINFIPKE